MTSNGAVDKDRAARLMMAALDDEISDAEREELERLVAGDSELEKEWARMRRVKEVTETMTFRQPPEEVWGEFWRSVYNRVERGVGWILASLGALTLLIYGAWQAVAQLLADSTVPGGIKIAIFAMVAGLLIVSVSVVREKLFVRGKDPYKEIQR